MHPTSEPVTTTSALPRHPPAASTAAPDASVAPANAPTEPGASATRPSALSGACVARLHARADAANISTTPPRYAPCRSARRASSPPSRRPHNRTQSPEEAGHLPRPVTARAARDHAGHRLRQLVAMVVVGDRQAPGDPAGRGPTHHAVHPCRSCARPTVALASSRATSVSSSSRPAAVMRYERRGGPLPDSTRCSSM
jgi:hypothetical protein